MFSCILWFFFLVSFFLIFLIMVQPTEGSDSIANVWETSSPFLSKIITEKHIVKITIMCAILFFILCIVLCNLNYIKK